MLLRMVDHISIESQAEVHEKHQSRNQEIPDTAEAKITASIWKWVAKITASIRKTKISPTQVMETEKDMD